MRVLTSANDPTQDVSANWCTHRAAPSVRDLATCLIDGNTATAVITSQASMPWVAVDFGGAFFRITAVTIVVGSAGTTNVQVRTQPNNALCGATSQDLTASSTVVLTCATTATGHIASRIEIRVLSGTTRLNLREVTVTAPDMGAFRMLVRRRNGVYTVLAQDSVAYNAGDSLTLRVETSGASLITYVNGTQAFAVSDTTFTKGTIALSAAYSPNAYFDNFMVTFFGKCFSAELTLCLLGITCIVLCTCPTVPTINASYGASATVIDYTGINVNSLSWNYWQFNLPSTATNSWLVVTLTSTFGECCSVHY